MTSQASLCQCNCGREVKPGRRFIWGHNSRVENGMKGYVYSKEEIQTRTNTRMLKGSYSSPSLEARYKMGEPHRGKTKSEEHRRNLSKSLMGHIVSTESLKKRSSTRKSLWTPELSKQYSKLAKQKWATGIFDNRKINLNSSGGYGIPTEYNGTTFRSRVESRVAKLLDLQKISWEYENTSILVKELNTSYLPDFYLPEFDVYLEVKYDFGMDDNIYKVEHLRSKGYKIIIVRNNEVNHLEKIYV